MNKFMEQKTSASILQKALAAAKEGQNEEHKAALQGKLFDLAMSL